MNSLRAISLWVMALLILTVGIIRFVRLDKAPDGYFVDEADSSMHVICLSETGHDAYGVRHPFMAVSGAGGLNTPTYLYPAIAWTGVFGHSRAAFRALAAFKTSLTLVGLFLLARLLMGSGAAFYVLLAATVSPWAFPFSRQAMDDPTLFPMGLVWGTFFFLRSSKIRDAVLAAFFFALAMYAYPPARAQVPLFGLPLILYKKRVDRVAPGFLLAFLATGVALCLPLIYNTLTGEYLVRYNVVGILSPQHRHRLGTDTFLGAASVSTSNFLKHFEPTFLFVTGDANLRHSSQFSGELSWLDEFVLAGGMLLYCLSILRVRGEDGWFRSLNPTFLLFLGGFLCGIVPAALTWESIPHALRAVGSWPFLALMTGFTLWKLESAWRWIVIPAALIAIIFFSLYLRHFFTVYPKISRPWFDVDVKRAALEAAHTGDWGPYFQYTASYGTSVTRRYYLVVYKGEACESSDTLSRSAERQ